MSIYNEIKEEIKDQYLADDNDRPWIIAFSGGKDSSTLLQIVWYALKELPKEILNRKIYVICNNTLVENPKVLKFVEKQLKNIQLAAVKEGLPITVDQTKPRLEDSFWINLIGKGYPAPTSRFRWCTERLKISPTSRYIMEKISTHGEAIILIGTRSDESANRAKSLKKHEQHGTRLRAHPLPNAKAYAPIKSLTTNQVWMYLQQVKNPWNNDRNRELVTLYKDGSEGDCPLVVDKSTPSCGNSRFGCWVCTVVKRDKSMEALITNGEDWMIPLMEIRDYLAHTVDRDNPNYEEDVKKFRMPIRRNKADGLGPYYPEVRKYILTKVLEAQKIAQDIDPEQQLISYQELVGIQVNWNRDFIFEFNVSNIYNSIFGGNIDLGENATNTINENNLLLEAANNDKELVTLISKLLKAQKNKLLLVKKIGLQNDIEAILEETIDPSFTNYYNDNNKN